MKSQDCGQKKEEKVRKSEVRKKVEVKKRHSSQRKYGKQILSVLWVEFVFLTKF